MALVRASSRNPEALPRLPKSPPKAGERGAGPFAHAAHGLSRSFLAVAVASVASRPFDALSASPMPGRQNFADELDTLALMLRPAFSWDASSWSGAHNGERRGEPRHGFVFVQTAQIIVGIHVRASGDWNTLAIARSISDLRQPRCIRSCSSVTRHGAHTNLPAYSPRRRLATARRMNSSVVEFIGFF